MKNPNTLFLEFMIDYCDVTIYNADNSFIILSFFDLFNYLLGFHVFHDFTELL